VTDKVVLGIDPGFVSAGFGIIRLRGREALLLDYGALNQSSKDSIQDRIACFHDFFTDKIVTYSVTELALETPFLGKNAQNFLKLGYLRGILLLLVARHNLALHEFAPREIKRALTGFGQAEKEQVARVVIRLFPSLALPKKLDVTDAIAIALCGLWAWK